MRKRVLLITNNLETGNRLFSFLYEFTYSVKICQSAKKVFDIADEYRPHLIICDIAMPVISGTELARMFKGRLPFDKVPFLLLVKKTDSVELDSLHEDRIPVDDLITMPVYKNDVISTTMKWLEADRKIKPATTPPVDPECAEEKPSEKQSWKKGKISISSITRLFVRIIDERGSGKLSVKGDRRKLIAVFDGGLLVETASNYIREDTLGRLLIKSGKISPDQNNQSLEDAKRINIPQGQMLIKMGLISSADLQEFLTKQKYIKCLKLFSRDWHGSKFGFKQGRLMQTDFTMQPVPLEFMLKEGLFKVASGNMIYDVFARNDKHQCTISLQGNFETVMERFSFDREDISLARGLDGNSVAELRAKTPGRFDKLIRIAYFLMVTKAGKFGDKVGCDPCQVVDVADIPVTSNETSGQKPEPEPVPVGGQWDMKAYRTALYVCRSPYFAGKYHEVIPLLKKALEYYPEGSEALAMLAWATFKTGSISDRETVEKAKELLKKAIANDASNDMAYLYLGKLLKVENKRHLAANYFREAVSINPENEEAQREVRLLEISERKSRDKEYVM